MFNNINNQVNTQPHIEGSKTIVGHVIPVASHSSQMVTEIHCFFIEKTDKCYVLKVSDWLCWIDK